METLSCTTKVLEQQQIIRLNMTFSLCSILYYTNGEAGKYNCIFYIKRMEIKQPKIYEHLVCIHFDTCRSQKESVVALGTINFNPHISITTANQEKHYYPKIVVLPHFTFPLLTITQQAVSHHLIARRGHCKPNFQSYPLENWFFQTGVFQRVVFAHILNLTFALF